MGSGVHTGHVAQPRGQVWGLRASVSPRVSWCGGDAHHSRPLGGGQVPAHPMAPRRSALCPVGTAHSAGGAALDPWSSGRARGSWALAPVPDVVRGSGVKSMRVPDPAGDSVALTPLKRGLGTARARGRGRAVQSRAEPARFLRGCPCPTSRGSRGAPSAGRGRGAEAGLSARGPAAGMSQ